MEWGWSLAGLNDDGGSCFDAVEVGGIIDAYAGGAPVCEQDEQEGGQVDQGCEEDFSSMCLIAVVSHDDNVSTEPEAEDG